MSEEEKIIVRIDAELKELIPQYLSNREQDIKKIEDALIRSDFGLIQSLGHSMKGSGGGYGFDMITEIGAEIEQAAKSLDKNSIITNINRLKNYLRRIEIHYE
jgi:HPt (histidine-containing phosphotransfer) domain-containing protein